MGTVFDSQVEQSPAYKLTFQRYGPRTEQYQTLEGAKYTLLNVKDVIRKELANPLVSKHIVRLPSETGGVVSELYQTKAWNSNP